MEKCDIYVIKLTWTLLFIKVHSDFVGAATRGAMAVIDGNVMAINPGEDAKWVCSYLKSSAKIST